MVWFFLLYLVAFFLGILACSMFGYVILQPFAKAVKGRQRPTRFTTVDFLWLTIMLQIPLVCLSNVGRSLKTSFETSVLATTTAIVVLLCIGVWWRGVATLSGLGIRGVWRRGVFLTILLPIAILGSAIGMPILIMSLAYSLFESHLVSILVSIAVLTPVVAYCFRLVSVWVLAELEPQPQYEEKSTAPD